MTKTPVFEFITSRQFLSWLTEQGASIVLSTYQAGKLFLLGMDTNGEMSLYNRTFNRCMGLHVGSEQLFMSSLYQLWRFDNSLSPGQTYQDYDRCYVPQMAWTTGDLDIHDIGSFLQSLLSRIDWRRDLHFQTCTTIDTLDYSGSALNAGSKVVMAASGPVRRRLPAELPGELRLPTGYSRPRLAAPGVLVLQGEVWHGERGEPSADLAAFCRSYIQDDVINDFPLIVIVDDAEFSARNLENLLWVTFTRSSPACDIAGIESFSHAKHWGCRGSLVVDARNKSFHAPPLEDDPDVERRVDALAVAGGVLHGLI